MPKVGTLTAPVAVGKLGTKPAEKATPPAPGELRYLALDALIPTPDNVRVIRKTDPAVLELRDSIAKLGVLQPVIARPHPKKPGKFDLRAGARRHMAAGLAGLKTIPVIVREMDDITAGVVTITENLDREDLTAMEQARAVNALLGLGFNVQEVAGKLGKTPAFVLRRAALSRLAKCWQEVSSKEGYCSWPASWWERIAPLPATTQQALFQEAHYWLGNRTSSAKELDSHIAEFTRELKRAKWPLDDPQLVSKAGACIECQKRSGCHPGLFDIGFDADPKEIKSKDRCLDANCWTAKEAAYIARRKRELTAEHGKVVLVSETGCGEAGTRAGYEVTRCKKDAKGATACLDEHGELFWATVNSERRAAAAKKNADGSASHVATGDAVMRAAIAKAFATARLGVVMAQRILGGGEDELTAEMAACAAHILAAGKSCYGVGAAQARDTLKQALGLSGKSWGSARSAKDLANDCCQTPLFLAAGALGYFDLALASHGAWSPEIPESLRKLAADGFIVTAEFLGCHLRADIGRVAVGLGLKANASATKADAIKAILAAKLPAGTLTPELAKAFGVKCSKPKAAKPAKKAGKGAR